MSSTLYAFFLSFLAGLSTLLGTIPIFFKIKNKQRLIASALAFAAGVMICVSFTDLIPEANSLLQSIFKPFPAILFLLIFFSIGVIFSMLIDKFFPAKEDHHITNQKLYHIGIVSMLAIILHNLPEGIATFLSTSENRSLGLALTLAIALHNIPEGISISIPVYYATGSKIRAFSYTLISGLSEPLGAIFAYLFLSPFINDFIMSILFCFIAGIMIHISVYELLKESKSYHYPFYTIFFFIFGFIFMLTSHLLMG